MSGYLVDANQLLYSINPASPHQAAVAEALRMLILGSHPTCLVPQSLTEFWVIATKPINHALPQASGLGLTTAQAKRVQAVTPQKLPELLRSESPANQSPPSP